MQGGSSMRARPREVWPRFEKGCAPPPNTPFSLPPPVYIPRWNIVCVESKEESLKPSEISRAKRRVRLGHSGGLNGGREGYVRQPQLR